MGNDSFRISGENVRFFMTAYSHSSYPSARFSPLVVFFLCEKGCGVQRAVVHSSGFTGKCTALAIGGAGTGGLSILCVAETFFCFHGCDKYRYISPGRRRENGNLWKERSSNIQLSTLLPKGYDEFMLEIQRFCEQN